MARESQRSAEKRAQVFAEHMHGEQTYGIHPYSFHLGAVRKVLDDFEITGALCVAAWLHDTLEDTKATRAQLETLFGDEVARLVWCVTGEGATRAERNASTYRKMLSFPGSIVLKLADRIANMEQCVDSGDARRLAMYRSEYPTFKGLLLPKSFNKPVPVRMWYRLDVSGCVQPTDRSCGPLVEQSLFPTREGLE